MNVAKSIGPVDRINRTSRSRSEERSEAATGFERSREGKEPVGREERSDDA
jgi:hypothetical protein